MIVGTDVLVIVNSVVILIVETDATERAEERVEAHALDGVRQEEKEEHKYDRHDKGTARCLAVWHSKEHNVHCHERLPTCL